jgi:ATP-dependent DNA helicase RecG
MAEATAKIKLQTPVEDLPGVSKRRAAALHRLDIHSVSDLLRHLPMRYEHEAAEGGIADLVSESVGAARGVIVAAHWTPAPGGYVRGRKGRFQATLEDPTGRLSLTWFNAPYLREKIHPGMTLRVQGKVKLFNGYPQMANPKWEVLDDVAGVAAKDERLRPVYPATEDLPSTAIEQIVADVLPTVLPHVIEPLPTALLEHHAMPTLAEALRRAHQPQSMEEASGARRRLAFNELLLLQLGIALKRAYVQRKMVAPPLRHSDAIARHIRERFPFELTPAQQGVIDEIVADLSSPEPMNRLLQGDVGAGKTVVALYAMLLAVANRRQAALMAPTELLAEQHHASISRMLDGSNVRLALLTAGQAPAGSPERAALSARIEAGEVDLVIGTQALLSESVRFRDPAVVVIDEQHRFGVLQRAAFRAERRSATADGRTPVPHHLVMTATPIPRTLSLTVFGDLDVSTIRGLPPGRVPVTNRVVGPEKMDEVYRYLRTRLERGEQAYVVVPLIDASGDESAKQLRSVREHVKLLQEKYLDGYRVAAVHGQLKRQTREQVMDRFRRGVIHVLVATTVIEVGVDVPNATVMVVEHAERFGLAQLHQLRGRIGRGSSGRRPLCVFVAEPTTDDAQRRMEAVASTNDGFRIAEMDLEIRGMGDFFGTRQHGLPPLRVAQIPEDLPLLQLARRDAAAIIAADPDLAEAGHERLRRLLLREYGEALGLIDVG